ncbi:xylulokinase [Rhabdothermincola salaria]|uniref:xylulokinase n=1 Tax=Rhabdothermincola salaria TaxID=2903142 RepID=UPI001E48963E|nr:FGGY-family carbohydrate kinase [Rhabdothermincola salaria]MCD9625344.1 FGGY-family carbohydrate kinase [Rhabdothermincola salaria]
MTDRTETPSATRPPAPRDPLVLAIDLGTGGPKVALVGVRGAIVGHAKVPVGLVLVDGGGAEQDPAEWWSAVVAAARQVLGAHPERVDDVVAVGVTSQWFGTVAVDDAGDHLGPAVIWMDGRGARYVRRAVRGPVRIAGYDVRRLRAWLRRTGGIPSLTGKDPVGHIQFLRHERPDVYRDAATFLEPVDYLGLRLTGRAAASGASITGHWVTDNRDLARITYDDELVAWTGIDRHKLPELVTTNSVLGPLAPTAADALGLRSGVPVVAGSSDTASAGIGSGAVDDRQAHLYVGTSSWLSCHLPDKHTDLRTNVTALPSGMPHRYWMATEQESAGICLTWLADQVLFPSDELAGAEPPDDLFDRLNQVAAGVAPGARGVVFTPWLNGERTPVDDATIRGGFHHLSLTTRRADLVRAVFEGVAHNSRWMLAAAERFVGSPFESLRFVGGGAQSELWGQIMADVLDRPVHQVAEPVLANARGAAFAAAVATGHLRWDEIPALVPVTAIHHPDPSTRAVHDRTHAAFLDIYRRTKGIHRRLGRHPQEHP